jgi:hypothetical protein
LRWGRRQYSEFALATEKDLVHSWQEDLRLGTTTPFAPCDFSEIGAYSEIGDADELILVTTSSSCPVDAFIDWTVMVLKP